MVFYYQEKEGSGQPTHSFWSWLIKTFYCSPNQKIFYIVVISFQPTRGVQYVMKTAQYVTKFYIYTLHNYFYLKICFLTK